MPSDCERANQQATRAGTEKTPHTACAGRFGAGKCGREVAIHGLHREVVEHPGLVPAVVALRELVVLSVVYRCKGRVRPVRGVGQLLLRRPGDPRGPVLSLQRRVTSHASGMGLDCQHQPQHADTLCTRAEKWVRNGQKPSARGPGWWARSTARRWGPRWWARCLATWWGPTPKPSPSPSPRAPARPECARGFWRGTG